MALAMAARGPDGRPGCGTKTPQGNCYTQEGLWAGVLAPTQHWLPMTLSQPGGLSCTWGALSLAIRAPAVAVDPALPERPSLWIGAPWERQTSERPRDEFEQGVYGTDGRGLPASAVGITMSLRPTG